MFNKEKKNLLRKIKKLEEECKIDRKRLIILWDEYCKKCSKNTRLENENNKIKKEIEELNNKQIDKKITIKDQKEVINKKDKIIDEYKKIIDENNATININEKKISHLEEFIGERHSDWHVEGGTAWRRNPITKKREIWDVPRDFNRGCIINPIPDDNFEMVKYKHIDNEEYEIIGDYNHPCSLYTFLGGTLFRVKEENSGYQTKSTIDVLKRKMMSTGLSIRGKNINESLQFIIDNPGKLFTAKEFSDKSNIKNRTTRSQYLKKLKKCDLIKEIKKGTYEVKFL